MSRNARLFKLTLNFAQCLAGTLGLLAPAAQLPLSTSVPTPFRARVVIVQDNGATETFRPVPELIHALVKKGISSLTGEVDAGAAWRSIVSTQDVVGLKVFSSPGPRIGTRPAVVEGVIEGLLAAKIPPGRIIIWDLRLSDLRRAGFDRVAARYGVRLAGSMDSGWDADVFYESSILGQPVFGDLEFQKKGEGVGRKSHVSQLVTKEITKIINISPLLNHNSAGVCGNLYSLAMGSVDNAIRFEGDSGKLAVAIPEIYALPELGDRVALNIVDALIAQYQGELVGHLHYSAALNQLRFSKDPVALDVLSIEELDHQRRASMPEISFPTNRVDMYRNAALLELGSAEKRLIDVQTVPVP